MPFVGDQHPRRYAEPLVHTLSRTLLIALAVSAGILLVFRPSRTPAQFAAVCAGVLWFSLGGHYVELLYLNVLRQRIAALCAYPHFGRILWWIAAGLLLGIAMTATWRALGATRVGAALPWWFGAALFPLVEFVVHAITLTLGAPNFWKANE